MGTERAKEFRGDSQTICGVGATAPNMEKAAHVDLSTVTGSGQRMQGQAGIDLSHRATICSGTLSDRQIAMPPPEPRATSGISEGCRQVGKVMNEVAGAFFGAFGSKCDEAPDPLTSPQPALNANLQLRPPQGGPGAFGL